MSDWPAQYVDPQTGDIHDWTDVVPADEDAYGGSDEPYTYRDLIMDQAEAHGMGTEGYLEHLAFRRGEDLDEKMSPSWVDDDDD